MPEWPFAVQMGSMTEPRKQRSIWAEPALGLNLRLTLTLALTLALALTLTQAQMNHTLAHQAAFQ